jgi:hypothetical protein
MTPHLTHYDQPALTWRWDFVDPGAELLQKELETIASTASDCGQEVTTTLNQMREVLARHTGRDLAPLAHVPPVPRLTESWFCCAEPTTAQTVTIGRR